MNMYFTYRQYSSLVVVSRASRKENRNAWHSSTKDNVQLFGSVISALDVKFLDYDKDLKIGLNIKLVKLNIALKW